MMRVLHNTSLKQLVEHWYILCQFQDISAVATVSSAHSDFGLSHLDFVFVRQLQTVWTIRALDRREYLVKLGIIFVSSAQKPML